MYINPTSLPVSVSASFMSVSPAASANRAARSELPGPTAVDSAEEESSLSAIMAADHSISLDFYLRS